MLDVGAEHVDPVGGARLAALEAHGVHGDRARVRP